MWDIHRRVPVELLPQRRVVVMFRFHEVRKERYGLLLEPGGVDVCYKDPGHPVDLYVTTSLRSLVSIWLGHRRFEQAKAAGDIETDGPRHLRAALPGWLGLSTFAPLGWAMVGAAGRC